MTDPRAVAVDAAVRRRHGTLPWLAGLTLNHFLERRNNGSLIPGGGWSMRIREKLNLGSSAELMRFAIAWSGNGMV